MSKHSSHERIGRWSTVLTGVALDTATPPVNATAIDFRDYAGGAVIVAATIASVTLTYYGCATIDGTYVPLSDAAGDALTSTLTGGAAEGIEIPAACFAYPYLKIASNADDAETVTVVLKG